MRKLASVVEIESCEQIPDTERLSVAKMVGKGWQVVVGRDEFKKGDLCVYFEIDSFIPADDDRFAFIKDRCLRRFVSKSGNVLQEGLKIKTIRLRGVCSQGLLMPIGMFPEVTDMIMHNPDTGKDEFARVDGSIGDVVGSDVTSVLRVEHYDEVKERLAPLTGSALCGDALGSFPSLIPKSDEERIQNLGDWFGKMKGRIWQVTQKHDGTSCTIAYSPTVDHDNPMIVCSRNLRLKHDSDGKIPVHWQMAEKYKILEKLKEIYDRHGIEMAIQGEIVGPGINGCKNKERDYKFYAFRAWKIAEQRFCNPKELLEFCLGMRIPHVNVIEKEYPFFDKIGTVEEALEFAQGKTPEGNEREGVVLKTVDEGEYASFKIVSNKYLMKDQD